MQWNPLLQICKIATYISKVANMNLYIISWYVYDTIRVLKQQCTDKGLNKLRLLVTAGYNPCYLHQVDFIAMCQNLQLSLEINLQVWGKETEDQCGNAHELSC